MKDQINTIREALEAIDNGCQANNLEHTLAALAQLEAMVGAQEPVGWVFRRSLIQKFRWHRDKPVGQEALLYWEPVYTAAPVAQQYESGDVASAAAQGFRDGVASVAQQPQAEAVSDDLRDRLVAISAAIADQDDRAAQAMIREILAAPQQAEAVPAWTTEQITAVAQPIAVAIAENCRTAPQLVFPHLFLGLKDLLTGTAPQQAESVPVAAFDRLMALCDSQAQRIIELEDKQPQAEAVPDLRSSLTRFLADKGVYLSRESIDDFMRRLPTQQAEAVPNQQTYALRWEHVANRANIMSTSKYKMLCELLHVEVDEETFDLGKAIDAAIAQQKGGV